ncbi:MAG: DUF349 domain-containing protein, partial [Oleibacter sp.]|nr:DUF349 domain-containing protein [Thalassolituus sp.]
PLQSILHEPDSGKQRQLIESVESPKDLETLLKSDNRNVQQLVREVWLARLLDQGQVPAKASTEALLRIASLSNDQAICKNAIERIDSVQERQTLAIEHPIARVRLHAAETLHDYDNLHAVMNAAQGKDKAVYRYCKQQLSELRAQQVARDALADDVKYIEDNAQQLLRLGYSPDFAGRVQVLQQRWAALQARSSDLPSNQAEALLQQVSAILAEHRSAEANAREAEEAQALAKNQQLDVLSRLESQLSQLSESHSAEWQSMLSIEQRAWAMATERFTATPEIQKRYDQTLQHLNQIQIALSYWEGIAAEAQPLLDAANDEQSELSAESIEQLHTWLEAIAWPNHIEAPSWLEQLRAHAGIKTAPVELAEANKDSNVASAKAIDEKVLKNEIVALMASMEEALDGGHAADAGKLQRRLQKAENALPHHSRKDVSGKIKLLTGRLYELRDWQGFAITPKKEALCTEMEALVEQDMAAPLRAERIKDLQNQWKELGVAGNDKDLWNRFHEAAEKAYEPCKAYFEEQAEIRAKLVERRDQLIAELNQYETQLDWASADWKAVQATLNAARDAFRDLSPVERNAHQRTQKQFNEVCDRIYAHVKEEYDRNIDIKKALVEKAEAAFNSEDISAATDTIKSLQQEWKNVGIVPKAVDQRLWQQFRRHCDGVFQRLGEQREERKAELNERVAAIETQVQAAVSAADTLADNAAQQLRDARDAMNASDLPKGAAVRLQKMLEQAEDAMRQQRQSAVNAAVQASWDALLTAIAENADTAPDALPEGIDGAWFSQTKTDENAADLCISMEILADIDTPAAEQAQRMQVQVKRLAEGLGRGVSKEQERAQLIQQWLSTSACSEQAQRFANALKASL